MFRLAGERTGEWEEVGVAVGETVGGMTTRMEVWEVRDYQAAERTQTAIVDL